MTMELTVFEQFEADLVCLEEANANMDFDVETADGEAECRDWHKKLRKGWNAVEKIRKDSKAEYLRLGREVDAEAKKYQSRVDAMAKPHKDKLDAKEARIRAELEAKIAAEELAKEIEQAEREAYIENTEIEHAKREAEIKAKEDVIRQEQERVELEKRIEEEKRQAAEQAKRKAEQDAKEAAELAEREKEEALRMVENVQHHKFHEVAKNIMEDKAASTDDMLKAVLAYLYTEEMNMELKKKTLDKHLIYKILVAAMVPIITYAVRFFVGPILAL